MNAPARNNAPDPIPPRAREVLLRGMHLVSSQLVPPGQVRWFGVDRKTICVMVMEKIVVAPYGAVGAFISDYDYRQLRGEGR